MVLVGMHDAQWTEDSQVLKEQVLISQMFKRSVDVLNKSLTSELISLHL